MIYNVSTTVETLGEGVELENFFRDGAGNPAYPTKAIFPIFQPKSSGVWQPVGTGFFLASNGFFATAKHVLTDNDGQLIDPLVGVHVIRKAPTPTVRIRHVVNVTLHERADLAIGFLEDVGIENHTFHLTTHPPEVGKSVVTFAIPKPAAVPLEGGSFELQFTPRLIRGAVEEIWPQGRGNYLRGYLFQTGMHFEGGGSGGPVFLDQRDGDVFAVNNTGMAGERPYSFHSSVSEILDMVVSDVDLEVNGKRVFRRAISVAEIAERGLIKIS
jgi:hypothetical protein